MYLYLKSSLKGGIQKINYKIINQHKNNRCHVYSLEKDFYRGAPNFFNCVFIHMQLKTILYLQMRRQII
jgi:hypothetical protein